MEHRTGDRYNIWCALSILGAPRVSPPPWNVLFRFFFFKPCHWGSCREKVRDERVTPSRAPPFCACYSRKGWVLLSRKTYREQQSMDDFLKIFAGLSLLGIGMGRRLGTVVSAIAVLVGASKVAEGITGYSPVPDLMRVVGIRKDEAFDGEFPREERRFPWEDADNSREDRESESPGAQATGGLRSTARESAEEGSDHRFQEGLGKGETRGGRPALTRRL